MNVDPEGNFPILITFVLAAFAVAGMVTGGLVASNQGKTGGELIGDILLGGLMGLAAGGALIAASAAIYGGIYGISAIMIDGLMARQVFAIGALAYNAVALFAAPIIGIEMQPIEWGNPSYKPERPGEAPKHPSERRSILASKGYWEISKQKRRTAKSD